MKRSFDQATQDSGSRVKRQRHAPSTPDKNFVIVSDNEEVENPFLSSRPRRTIRTPSKYIEAIPDSIAIEKSSADQENSPVKDEPCTPRHHDRISKKIAITPRHRVGLLSRPATPQTNRTPSTPRSIYPSIYNDARRLFRGSLESTGVIGREKELQEVTTFITTRHAARSSGCLYISGPPGTGKSALVTQALRALQQSYDLDASYCNCMSVKTVSDIYEKLFEDFNIADAMKGTEISRLKKVFQNRKRSHIVILDEIDHLLDVDLELLYQLFEWSMQESSSLVLIGIANALDLTDRFLPRLKSKNLRPQLMPFMPYSIAEISNIITTKLQTMHTTAGDELVGYVPFIHPTAISFLSKKVAAQTGDIRKAFAVCLRALDVIEADTQSKLSQNMDSMTPSASASPSKTPLAENAFLSSPSKPTSPQKVPQSRNPMVHLTAENAPRVTIAHMARVTATVFSNGLTQRMAALNLQQKAALCALSALEMNRQAKAADVMLATPSKSSKSAPTVRAVFEAYSRLCKQDNVLHALSISEFRDIMASLDTLSLISCVSGKAGSLAATAGTPSRRGRQSAMAAEGMEGQRVASVVGVKELKDSLSGAGSGILLTILDGDALI